MYLLYYSSAFWVALYIQPTVSVFLYKKSKLNDYVFYPSTTKNLPDCHIVGT